MIGRLLCRLGLHRWDFSSGYDINSQGRMVYVTVSWCKRCDYPLQVVDVEDL